MLSCVNQCSATVTQHLTQSAYHGENVTLGHDSRGFGLCSADSFGSVVGTASWLGCVAKDSCSVHGGREAKWERERPPSQDPLQGTHL